MLNTDSPVELRWGRNYWSILESVAARLGRQNERPTDRVAYALLSHMHSRGTPTPDQVVDAIHENLTSPRERLAFDRDTWLALVPRVVEALQSHNPIEALRRL